MYIKQKSFRPNYLAVCLQIRDGPQWSQRRRSLNKVFLKSTTISEYADVFNCVVGDFLAIWDHLFDHNSNETKVEQLEKELYNWSIECKFEPILFNFN